MNDKNYKQNSNYKDSNDVLSNKEIKYVIIGTFIFCVIALIVETIIVFNFIK
jgi:hypothetical protein